MNTTSQILKTHLYKACQRCGGDLVLDQSDYQVLGRGPEYVCLQCGRSTAVATVQATVRQDEVPALVA